MKEQYLVYYDAGTSNTRIYLLDGSFRILYTKKVRIGSKEVSIQGSNRILIETLNQLYEDMLADNHLSPQDIPDPFYASGMVTSPYGLEEVPHLTAPADAAEFAAALHPYREDQLLHRDFLLVPGLRTERVKDITEVNNMRGEEIEALGASAELEKTYGGRSAAVIFPGSHTHTLLMQHGRVNDILSQLTGELFYALKTDTVLASVLQNRTEKPDPEMIHLGMHNLQKYGFNRALYICHSMRIFNEGTPEQRYAYCEGVLNGGYATALETCCREKWKDCSLAVVVGNAYMYGLYSEILRDHPYIKEVVHFPISDQKSYAVEGLRAILQSRKG